MPEPKGILQRSSNTITIFGYRGEVSNTIENGLRFLLGAFTSDRDKCDDVVTVEIRMRPSEVVNFRAQAMPGLPDYKETLFDVSDGTGLTVPRRRIAVVLPKDGPGQAKAPHA